MLIESEPRAASAAAKKQDRQYAAKAVPAKSAATALVSITAEAVAAAAKK